MVISHLPRAVSQWSQILHKPVTAWSPYDLLTDYRQCADIRVFLLSSIVGLGSAGPLAVFELEESADGRKGDLLKKMICWEKAIGRLQAISDRRCASVGKWPLSRICRKAKGSVWLIQGDAQRPVPFADLTCTGEESSEEMVEILAPILRRKLEMKARQPLYFKIASCFLTEEWFRIGADNELSRISAIEAIEVLTYPKSSRQFPYFCLPLLLCIALSK